MSQKRLIAILLGAVAALVLVVGVLSMVAGGDGGDGGGGGGTAASLAEGGDGGSSGGSSSASWIRLPGRSPVTMDPHLASDASSAEYIVEIMGGLVTISPPPELAIVPDLAADYPQVSDDGLTFTFTLRDDIFFHSRDRRRVTAEDVKWSIERAASPFPIGATQPSATARAYLGDIVGVREKLAGVSDDVEGIRVIDERTIEFTLREPIPPSLFLAKLTYPTAFVVDRKQIEADPRNWTRAPNGTGPYVLREWRVNERIALEANERYHLGEPLLAGAIYELAGGSVLTRFETGELDVATVSIFDIERARDPDSDLYDLYVAYPQFTISYIAFDNSVPPFDDVNVRRALALSIDREKIARVTFNGMLLPASGILPPQLPGYTAEQKTYEFDPEAARAALAASSYGSAENLPLILMTEVGSGAEAGIDTQAFLEQWKEVLGVDVEIRQTDFATFLADQDAGRLQMFNAAWIMDYPDPEDILDLLFHSQSSLNRVRYANDAVDALLSKARVEQDPAARIAMYQEVERLIIEDVAWIPLYFSQAHIVVSEDVKGWFEPPMIIPRLRFVVVER